MTTNTDPSIFQVLNVGAVGVVLIWFMTRVEKRLDTIAASIAQFSRVILLDMLARRPDQPVRQAATDLLTEIERPKS